MAEADQRDQIDDLFDAEVVESAPLTAIFGL